MSRLDEIKERLASVGHTHRADLFWAVAEIERLQGIVDKLPNRCRECGVYSSGCGSEYDGVCKHWGLPPATQLGRPPQTWRHVYRYDSCSQYVFEKFRTMDKAAAKAEKKKT